MKAIVEGTDDTNHFEMQDGATGLYPFMLAGVRNTEYTYDLSSIYYLIKRSLLLVRKYDDEEETLGCDDDDNEK